MYHSISNDDESVVHPYYSIQTTPEAFTWQMQYLYDSGYKAVELGKALELVHSSSRILEKVVVLTFDDGYMDFYTEAVAILRRFGYAATVYLPSSMIKDRISHKFNGKVCLTWDKVTELSDAGYYFGSHSATHKMLRNMKEKEVKYEIYLSKAMIEDKIGKQVDSFSYPYAFPEEDGEYKASLRRLLSETGYRNGVSTNIGRISSQDDRYFLKRIPVNSHDDIDLFRAKIAGAYDWMFNVQKAFKYLKKIATFRNNP